MHSLMIRLPARRHPGSLAQALRKVSSGSSKPNSFGSDAFLQNLRTYGSLQKPLSAVSTAVGAVPSEPALAPPVSDFQRMITTLRAKQSVMLNASRSSHIRINNTSLGASIAANRSYTSPVSTTTHIPTNSFFWQGKPKSQFEFNSDRPLANVILDVDKPVFTNYFPFNILYLHASEYVIPIDPQDPGYKAGRAYLYLLATCVTVLFMWQVSTALPIAKPPPLMDPMNENSRSQVLREVLAKVSPSELKALGAKADWMTKNFTVNGESIIHRPWTMLTSAISHQDLGHLAGNFFSLFLFMPKVYSFLGPRYFAGLYVAGAVGCSVAHAVMNKIAGRTQQPYGFVDMLILSERLSDDQMERAFEGVDVPSLGASGSCMAVSAASALLFPRDRVMLRGAIFIPIPVAALMFIFSDLLSLVATPNSGVAHSGHLGGVVAGSAYIAFLWYSRFMGPLAPFAKYKAHLPIIEWFHKAKPNPIVAHVRN